MRFTAGILGSDALARRLWLSQPARVCRNIARRADAVIFNQSALVQSVLERSSNPSDLLLMVALEQSNGLPFILGNDLDMGGAHAQLIGRVQRQRASELSRYDSL